MPIPDDVRQRAGELRRSVEHHAHLYYVEDRPEITDAEYDALFRELQALEDEYPELRTPDSPTQRVGGPTLERFEQVAHLQPMLSLANARNADELLAWEARNRRILETAGLGDVHVAYVTEPKIDGLAISLVYRGGVFERGATRGNGEIGEDVTANLRTIPSIPLRLRGDDPPAVVEVRGEVYLPLAGFARLNEQRTAEGQPTFVNPRNAAAGSIRQLDPAVAAARPLRIWCYAVGHSEGLELEAHWQALAWLRERGLPTNPASQRHESIDEVVAACAAWEERRDEIDYDIDGVVVKADQFAVQRELGEVAHDPRWAIAFKFAPTTAHTELLAIDINVGRTGVLTPFAVLAPVFVGGVTVERATLHNENDIRRKDIREGDVVILQRAGDVIPQVVGPLIRESVAEDAEGIADTSAVARERRAEWAMPKTCPACGSRVVREEGEVAVRCPNHSCPAQIVESIRHFVSRGAMDIEGVGEEIVQLLHEQGLITDVADLYDLRREHFVRLEGGEVKALPGFGGKTQAVKGADGRPLKGADGKALRELVETRHADNVLAAIEASKRQPFARVLFGLGIRHVGGATAQLLVEHFPSLDALQAATDEQIGEVPGVGPAVAGALREYFGEAHNRETLAKLRAHGLRFVEEAPQRIRGPLSGKSFVLTGTLAGMPRSQAKARIEALGGRVSSSVSAATDYVVCGENPGSKLDKARKAGVDVLDEEGFTALLTEAGAGGEPVGSPPAADLDQGTLL